MIVVMKGKERFEIDRDASTKVTGELKVGDKVTIMYTMTAKSVEVKADKSREERRQGEVVVRPSSERNPKLELDARTDTARCSCSLRFSNRAWNVMSAPSCSRPWQRFGISIDLRHFLATGDCRPSGHREFLG